MPSLPIFQSPPAFAHCPNSTRGINDAVNTYLRSNNFTQIPSWVTCVPAESTKIASEKDTILAWSMSIALIIVFAAVAYSFSYDIFGKQLENMFPRCVHRKGVAEQMERAPLIPKKEWLNFGTTEEEQQKSSPLMTYVL